MIHFFIVNFLIRSRFIIRVSIVLFNSAFLFRFVVFEIRSCLISGVLDLTRILFGSVLLLTRIYPINLSSCSQLSSDPENLSPSQSTAYSLLKLFFSHIASLTTLFASYFIFLLSQYLSTSFLIILLSLILLSSIFIHDP